MSPNKITTQIAEILKRPLDNTFKLQLGDLIKTQRSLLIRRRLEKHPEELELFQESIIIPMKVGPFTCDGTNCIGALSTIDIPKSIPVNGTIYPYIGAVDGSRAFQLVTSGFISELKQRKFPPVVIELINNKLRVHEPLKSVRIDFVPDDPEEVSLLKCSFDAATEDCDYWDKPFKASQDIVDTIIKEVAKLFLPGKEQTEIPV